MTDNVENDNYKAGRRIFNGLVITAMVGFLCIHDYVENKRKKEQQYYSIQYGAAIRIADTNKDGILQISERKKWNWEMGINDVLEENEWFRPKPTIGQLEKYLEKHKR